MFPMFKNELWCYQAMGLQCRGTALLQGRCQHPANVQPQLESPQRTPAAQPRKKTHLWVPYRPVLQAWHSRAARSTTMANTTRPARGLTTIDGS
jgi:hypothetical protein